MDAITTKDEHGRTRLICNDCYKQGYECLSCEKLQTALDTLHAYESTAFRLVGALVYVSDIYDHVDTPQSLYVIEECSELTKELIKYERGKNNDSKIVEEACDVLSTVLTLLYRRNVKAQEIVDRIIYKCKRVVERFDEEKNAQEGM